MTTSLSAPRVAIIGAGIIGLTCAWELARRGAQVTLYDSGFHPGRGASWAAAGMLAPAYEAAGEPGVNPKLFDLCIESARQWSAMSATIRAATKRDVLHAIGPSLAVAQTAEDQTRMAGLAKALTARHVAFDVLSPGEAVEAEPCLRAGNRGALRLPTDGQVDNRLLVDALIRALEQHEQVAFVKGTAPLDLAQGKIVLDGFDRVVLAAGWETARVVAGGSALGEIAPVLREIEPVAGHMLAFNHLPDGPVMTLRCGALYIVPKAGRVVVGASVEPGETRTQIDWEAIRRLEAAAQALCPMLKRATIIEAWRGIRPGTPDHAPMIGPLGQTGALIAAGHYRNGILLAPVTAQIMADMILDGKTSALAEAFSPARFAAATA
ncbi:glycine oxidase ThiO [Hyphomonas sp.]|uniref:glycine oxidase ThiO n=1 Tax=Hyphomonas sp. TaxID=87 RepID=UPI0032ED05B5